MRNGRRRPRMARDLLVEHPDRRDDARLRLVLERDAQRTGAHLVVAARRTELVEGDRQGLPVAGRLAAARDEMRRVGHRLEDDDVARRQQDREQRLLSGGKLEDVERGVLEFLLEALVRQVDAGAPEDLPEILERRQGVRIVGGDAAHARADGEDDLDHLVEGRLVARPRIAGRCRRPRGRPSGWYWRRARRRNPGRARSTASRRCRGARRAGRRR